MQKQPKVPSGRVASTGISFSLSLLMNDVESTPSGGDLQLYAERERERKNGERVRTVRKTNRGVYVALLMICRDFGL